MKTYDLFCPQCNKYCKCNVKTIEETYAVKGDNISINALVSFCSECGEEVWNDELDENNLQNAYTIYRTNHGLLQPHEICNIREKYGVSQILFARILGLGDKTITRYENGSIQDKAQNNLIALVSHPENFKELVEQNRGIILDPDYERILSALNTLTIKLYVPQEKNIYEYNDSSIIVTNEFFGGIRKCMKVS